jgi:DNA topoisomerase VI subunit B
MSDTSKNWFEIDRKGLAKLLERRGKIALIHELISNALDADGVSRIEVELTPEEGVPQATVIVRDDAPGGFSDMSHAWTMFAESSRKGSLPSVAASISARSSCSRSAPKR